MRSEADAPAGGPPRSDVVDDLNRLMAEEAEACLRYFQMRFRLSGDDYTAAAPFFEDAIKETFEHADAIAQRIRALGQIPALRVNLSLGGGAIRLEVALAEALDVEEQALDAYTEFLSRVAGDPELEAFVRHQVEIETEHVQQIREFMEAKATLKLASTPTRGE